MLPDLSSHIHTAECNFLIERLKECQKSPRSFWHCNWWYEAVWQCTQAERLLRKKTNPKYKPREEEFRRLPEELWTPALRKLKAEGKLNIPEDESPQTSS